MKGFIYAIRSHQTEHIYIGSTIQQLCKRFGSHKRDYRKWTNGKYYNVSSFEILKYDDAYIELIEIFEFNEKTELFAREGHYIRTMECVNKNIIGRTKKEYYNDNKDKINKRVMDYYNANKDKINKCLREKRKN